MIELRPYQLDAIERTLAAETAGVRAQLGVAATGLGKTVMFAALAEQLGGRALILAHRDELVGQAVAKVREVWPGVQVGIVKGQIDEHRSHVVVASVQTLSRPNRLKRFVESMADTSWLVGPAEPLRLVVVDEAHHATADSYRRVLDELRAGALDGPLLLGVTATPDRGDGKGLIEVFSEIVWSFDMLWGIRAGYLSDVRGKRVRLERLDVKTIKVSKGDYEAGAAGRALEDADAPAQIVKAWKLFAAERRTLVFTPTVALAHAVAAEYAGAGVSVGVVSGETPIDERRQLLADYSAGRVQVVCNCAVLTEGYDEPRTDCIVIARPTKSRAFYTQMVGRGTRKHPEKADLLVLDVVGATDSLALVTVPSLFGIEGRKMMEQFEAEGAVAAIDARDQREVAEGRLRAEDVDLFHKVRQAGRLAWVQTSSPGATLKRYVLQLDRDHEVVLAMTADGTAWRCGRRKAGEWRTLCADVSMEQAQAFGEDYARVNVSHGGLIDPSAPWRRKRPTDAQKDAARKWHIAPEKIAACTTAGELGDLITQAAARARTAQRYRSRARK